MCVCVRGGGVRGITDLIVEVFQLPAFLELTFFHCPVGPRLCALTQPGAFSAPGGSFGCADRSKSAFRSC